MKQMVASEKTLPSKEKFVATMQRQIDEQKKKNPDKKDKKKELPPQIMILASGDVNSFDLQFEREGTDSRWHVFSRPDSSVVAEQVLEEI